MADRDCVSSTARIKIGYPFTRRGDIGGLLKVEGSFIDGDTYRPQACSGDIKEPQFLADKIERDRTVEGGRYVQCILICIAHIGLSGPIPSIDQMRVDIIVRAWVQRRPRARARCTRRRCRGGRSIRAGQQGQHRDRRLRVERRRGWRGDKRCSGAVRRARRSHGQRWSLRARHDDDWIICGEVRRGPAGRIRGSRAGSNPALSGDGEPSAQGSCSQNTRR